jgi:hypothetical protein
MLLWLSAPLGFVFLLAGLVHAVGEERKDSKKRGAA